jgi:hypothetical protein
MYTFRPVKKGTTDVTVYVRVIDSSDGTPETSVAYDTAGIDLWYMRDGADHTAITEATQTAAGAHSDGGFVHISDGWCRLDLPDAACATGVDGVMVGGTITGMLVLGCYIPLVAYDPYDTVRMGMTALPNAAADAAGGLPISDAGGLDLDAQIGTDIDAILTDTAEIGTAGAGLTALLTQGATIDGSITTIELMRLLLAKLYTADGGGTSEITYYGQDGTTPRITMTVDAVGDRSVVTLDGSEST